MKNDLTEDFFLSFNQNIKSNSKKKNLKNLEFKFKPIFIISLPRGASTFLHQILISSTNVGYVSNLIALFWNFPELGASLQKKFFRNTFVSSFKSEFGNTEGIFEPHEWGFFWRKWLQIKTKDDYYNFENKIKWMSLKSELVRFEEVLKMPLVFDTAYANTHMEEINYYFKPKFIFLYRSPLSVCNSILKARLLRYKNLNRFFAAKPRNFNEIEKIKNPVEQVVAQVWYIFQEMEKSISELEKNSYTKVKYEEFFSDFDSTLQKIIKFTTNDFSVMSKSKKFPKFSNRNKDEFFDIYYKKEFDFFYQKYFNNFNYKNF